MTDYEACGGWDDRVNLMGRMLFFSPPIILGNSELSIRAEVLCVFTHQFVIGLASIIHWLVQITSPKQYFPISEWTTSSANLLEYFLVARSWYLCVSWMTRLFVPLFPAPMRLESQVRARWWMGLCPRKHCFLSFFLSLQSMQEGTEGTAIREHFFTTFWL